VNGTDLPRPLLSAFNNWASIGTAVSNAGAPCSMRSVTGHARGVPAARRPFRASSGCASHDDDGAAGGIMTHCGLLRSEHASHHIVRHWPLVRAKGSAPAAYPFSGIFNALSHCPPLIACHAATAGQRDRALKMPEKGAMDVWPTDDLSVDQTVQKVQHMGFGRDTHRASAISTATSTACSSC